MSMITTNHNHKINKALHLLGEVAQVKKEELGKNIDRLKKVAEGAIQEGGARIKETALTVDQSVHNKPWAYIGGAAATAFVLGFFLGKTRNK